MRGDILGLAGPRSMVSTILSTSEAARRLRKCVAENTEPSQLLEVVVMLKTGVNDFLLKLVFNSIRIKLKREKCTGRLHLSFKKLIVSEGYVASLIRLKLTKLNIEAKNISSKRAILQHILSLKMYETAFYFKL